VARITQPLVVTSMRDPVERFLSAYEFAVQNAQRLLDKQTTLPPLSRSRSRRRRRRGRPDDDDDGDDDGSGGGGGGGVASPLSNATDEAAAAPDGQRRYEGQHVRLTDRRRRERGRERCAVRHTRLHSREHSPGRSEREHEGSSKQELSP
jgi:hypothetical protein